MCPWTSPPLTRTNTPAPPERRDDEEKGFLMATRWCKEIPNIVHRPNEISPWVANIICNSYSRYIVGAYITKHAYITGNLLVMPKTGTVAGVIIIEKFYCPLSLSLLKFIASVANTLPGVYFLMWKNRKCVSVSCSCGNLERTFKDKKKHKFEASIILSCTGGP